MAAATQNGAASKNLETQGCGLFVALERWIDGALELTQDIETIYLGLNSDFGLKDAKQRCALIAA